MRNLLLAIIITIAAALLCAGCSSDACNENRATLPLAGFYNEEGRAVGLDSLCIYGIGGDVDSAVVAAPGTRITRVYLPMRPGADRTIWVVSYKQKSLDYPELNDTLTFAYTSSPYFASGECGVIMDYALTRFSYTKHLIDSVAITDSLFNNVDVERIKIYFRTASDTNSGDEQ